MRMHKYLAYYIYTHSSVMIYVFNMAFMDSTCKT